MHDKLITSNLLCHRGVKEDPTCPRCGLGAERVVHVIRDCWFARLVWLEMWSHYMRSDFFTALTAGLDSSFSGKCLFFLYPRTQNRRKTEMNDIGAL